MANVSTVKAASDMTTVVVLSVSFSVAAVATLIEEDLLVVVPVFEVATDSSISALTLEEAEAGGPLLPPSMGCAWEGAAAGRRIVGRELGDEVGRDDEGDKDGSLEGAGTGCSVGCALGGLDGEEDGCGIGGSDGSTDGRGDGGGVGPSDGTGVGSGVGGGSWTSKKNAGASSFAALPLVVELREGGCSLSMA